MIKLLLKIAMLLMLVVIIKLTADLVFAQQVEQLHRVHFVLGASITRDPKNITFSDGAVTANAWYDPQRKEVVLGNVLQYIDGTLVHESTHGWDYMHSSNKCNSYYYYYTQNGYEALTCYWSGSEDVQLKELTSMCKYGQQNSTEFLACSVQNNYTNVMSAKFYASTHTEWYRYFANMDVLAVAFLFVSLFILVGCLVLKVLRIAVE